MRFRVLGPVAVRQGDGEQEAQLVASPNQRTVLAVLLAAGGRAVPSDELIAALWGEAPPPSARQSLRTYVSRLRHLVGDRLVAEAGAYRLHVAGDTVDARDFEVSIDASGHQQPADAAQTLLDALELWAGRAFDGAADVPRIAAECRRLEELRVSAAEGLARSLLESGDAAGAAARAEAVVAEHELREGAWTVLVAALAADQRQAEALRAFQRAKSALNEAGLEPSVGLREAEAAVLSSQRGRGGDRAPARKVPESVPEPLAALPPSEPLVGRDVDLADLHAALDEFRLVTVTGPGGVGKTSLALAACRRRAERHRLGVRVAELAHVGDPAAVPAVVADALGLTTAAGSTLETLRRAGALDVLVVLDNCEHLLDAVAGVAEALLAGGARARLLATSRERIGVVGEQAWPIGPLSTDGPYSSAVQLFVRRARAHAPKLAIGLEHQEGARADRAGSQVPSSGDELAVIERIVATLDGIPLAIEMAASRVGGLGVHELAELLDERFDFLRSARRRGDPRHRTLAAVIEWSEALLEDEERDVLAALAVFAGPVLAADIEAVLDRPAVLATIDDLVQRSMVEVRHHGSEVAYRLLEMVRRHAGQRLVSQGGAEALARRHAEHFLDVARSADAALRTDAEGAASRTLERAHAELRLAHGWARARAPEVALGLSASLHHYAASRQRDEIFSWAVASLPLVADGPDSVVTLCSAGYRANNLGRLADARDLARRALDLAGGDPVARFACEVLSDAAIYDGELEDAERFAWEMHSHAQVAGDGKSAAMAIAAVALSRAYAGRGEEARSLLDGCEVTSPPSAAAWRDYALGEVILDRDPQAAVLAFERAVELGDAVGDRFVASVARVSEVSLRGRVGNPADALGAFASIIDHWHRRGDRTHLLTTVRNLVVLFSRIGAHEAAAELWGATAVSGSGRSFGEEAQRLQSAAARARSALGERFEERSRFGAGLDETALTSRALALIDQVEPEGRSRSSSPGIEHKF